MDQSTRPGPSSSSSSEPYDYDLLVVGGGAGGLAVAKEASGLGRRVLILDLETPSPKGTKMGLGGASMRKLLHQASLLGKALADAPSFGWRFQEAGVSHSWTDLVAVLQQQVTSGSVELKKELRDGGVCCLSAHGEITAPHTVQVTDVNGTKISLSAETLVIATGDGPRYLDVAGARELCLTSDGLFSLPHSPGRTLVVGGSADGMECAGVLLGLGLQVTVLLQTELLPGLDTKMAQKIENHMLVHGVDFIHHHSLSKVERIDACSKDVVAVVLTLHKPQKSRSLSLRKGERNDRVAFSISGEDIPRIVDQPIRSLGRQYTSNLSDKEMGKTILSQLSEGLAKINASQLPGKYKVVLTVGRKACTSGIGLERVGVKCSRAGGILVNEREQTSVDHVFALGSVQHGRPSAAGLAVQAGALLARRLYAGETAMCDYTNVPTVLFTPLEYAACGLSEDKANVTFGEANIEVYHSYYWPLEWTVPARDKNSSYVKVICHISDHERVVGLHIMGPNAGDTVQGFAAAMKCGLTKQQLDSTVGIHPVSAKVFTTLTLTQRMSEAMMVRGNC
ncbi:thioredoxin reductase 1, cytoplasmic-like [Diretmus argenteus]